MELFGLVPRN